MNRAQIYIFQNRKKQFIWTDLDLKKEDYVLYNDENEKYMAIVIKTLNTNIYNSNNFKIKEKNDKKKNDQKEKKIDINKKIQKATDEEVKTYLKNKIKAKECFESILKDLNKLKLDINLVDVFINYDNSKLIIYYTAENRVDFRESVKYFAKKYKKRIEMVQISVVDETMISGGIGKCGRKLCCISFLANPLSTSIKTAKNQDLSINIENISGKCGKLMCCLNYENDVYLDIKKGLAKIGDKVKTEEGIGEVVDIDTLKKVLRLKFYDENSDIYFKKVKINENGETKILK